MSWQRRIDNKTPISIPSWFAEAKQAGKSKQEIMELAKGRAEEVLLHNANQNGEPLPDAETHEYLADCIYEMYQQMYELKHNG